MIPPKETFLISAIKSGLPNVISPNSPKNDLSCIYLKSANNKLQVYLRLPSIHTSKTKLCRYKIKNFKFSINLLIFFKKIVFIFVKINCLLNKGKRQFLIVNCQKINAIKDNKQR
uniref:Uncharacterized protein n=1 Tax=Meloidogyne enterolobii TaxID=390850 RepID=A0A6V7WCG6_MELEN|nr:unnamed protein product [Meloidogyne enterolobii]